MQKNYTEDFEHENDEQIMHGQQPVTNFRAVKKLKEAEGNIESVRNRIHMLQMTEEKNQKKMEEEEKRIQRIMEIKEKSRIEKAQKQRLLMKRNCQLDILRERNQQNKRQQESKLANLRQELYCLKMNESLEMRLKSEQIDKKIRLIKKKYHNDNIHKRNNVVLLQQKQRQSQIDHYKDKVASIHSQVDKETLDIMKKRKEKENQLRKMEELEMKLLEKCSRSSQALKQVQDKLEKVLYKKEQNNLAHNKKPESSETADV